MSFTLRHPVHAAALLLVLASTSAMASTPAFEAKIAATKKELMADPHRALVLAREANKLGSAIPDARARTIAIATSKWLEAEALIDSNRAEEARVPAEQAARLVGRVGGSSKLAGDIERSLGAIAAGNGDMQVALRRYQTAYRHFTAAGDTRSRAIMLVDIGHVYWDAGDYHRVLRYFSQAEELMPADDAKLQLGLLNSRGEVLRALRRYSEAETAFSRAVATARNLGSDVLETRIQTNLAISQAMAGRSTQAAASVQRGFALARNPDVVEWLPYLHAAAALIAERKGDYRQAGIDLGRAFRGQDIAKTEMSWRETHELAAIVYERLGRKDEALRHLRAFQRLDKEAQRLIATNSAQLMAAQFDFANQDLRIAQLKQGQLERDIRHRTIMFASLLAAAGVVLALLAIGLVSLRRSRDKVRSVNAELETSNDRLTVALKAKSEFLATTSHEIRTPLNGILGMTQVLLADRKLAREARERIEVVHGAGETMRALVDDLLDVAKLEHGGLTLAVEPVDMDRLVRDAATLWRAPAEAKGLQLRVEQDADLPQVMTDGGRVRQILFNLLSNAVKFTRSGSVVLRCRLDRISGNGAILEFVVEDTGIGIDAADHAHIFEAFAQVDGGTTREFSGTGLGLSIVGSLVKALGGAISVASEAGDGAAFTVRLPVEELDAHVRTGGRRTTDGLATASVLLIDPDQASRSVMQILLMGHAARVVASGSLDEALRLLDQGRVDLVIVDAAVVDATGDRVAALRRLRATTGELGSRLAILRGENGPTIAETMMIGADQTIVKPIGAGELIAALASLWADEPRNLVMPALLDQHVQTA